MIICFYDTFVRKVILKVLVKSLQEDLGKDIGVLGSLYFTGVENYAWHVLTFHTLMVLVSLDPM